MILHQGRPIYRVHVGGINYSTTVDMLRQAFGKFGTVLEGTEIIHDKEGRSKGFGFVNFAEESAFKKAIEQMNGRKLDGRTICVTSAQPERKYNETTSKRRNGLSSSGPRPTIGPYPFRGYRVTIQNLHPTVTWPDLKDFLRKAGEVQFADVVGPGMGIGEFATPQERANVIRQLNGKELKGNRVAIRNLHEADPRFNASRPNGNTPPNITATNNGQFPGSYFPEPFEYGPNPHHGFDVPFNPGFDHYSFNNGAPNGGPINGGGMEFNPTAAAVGGFVPPPSRVPHWTQPPGRGTGRGYPPFVAPYPPPPGAFPRAQVRPVASGWMYPSAPVRPCLPGRAFERPPPPATSVYAQPGVPVAKTEYEHQGDMSYRRSPPVGAVVDMQSADHLVYQNRPTSVDREYPSYPAGGRYSAPIADSPQREKTNGGEYSRSKDDWSLYFGYPNDSQVDGTTGANGNSTGPYVKYENQNSGTGRPLEKPESSGVRPYGRYPVHGEDPRIDYADYGQSRSIVEDRRKDYTRSGYTGYLNSSYSRSTTDQSVGGYDYGKTQRTDDYGKYRIEDYSHGGGGGDGYPSSDAYSKDPPDYEYPRGDTRSYGSEYDTRDGSGGGGGGGPYYNHRTSDYPERTYRDEDPRGAGGADRSRQRTHRTGPYDH